MGGWSAAELSRQAIDQDHTFVNAWARPLEQAALRREHLRAAPAHAIFIDLKEPVPGQGRGERLGPMRS